MADPCADTASIVSDSIEFSQELPYTDEAFEKCLNKLNRDMKRLFQAGRRKIYRGRKNRCRQAIGVFKRDIAGIRLMFDHRQKHHPTKHYEPYSDTGLSACGNVLDRKTSIQVALPLAAEKIADGMDNKKLIDASNSIFDLLTAKSKFKDKASLVRLLRLLKHFGLQENDPRLSPITEYIHKNDSLDDDTYRHYVSREQFFEIISPCLQLVGDTIRNQSVIPNWVDFVEIIRALYETCKSITDGSVATYIPQLKRQDPHLWGVAVCSVDGQRISFGDSKKLFCLQSVSKAFNYAIVSNDIGPSEIHKYVGYEPSGRLFNEICLDPSGKPHNPMINAGAILVTSLIREDQNMADRFEYMLKQYRRFSAGETVGFDNATFLSERDTADRNYALSYYMKENKCFPKMKREEEQKAKNKKEQEQRAKDGLSPQAEDRKKPDQWKLREELDLYFQLCSIQADCESASVMAATLANGGVNPLTREKVIDSVTCRNVLSLMYSCGMYDFSGKFSFMVGLPAKSGVSGAMVVVIPNVAGFCLFSPPLDPMGNTVRGVKFCRHLVERYNFHNYDSVLNVDEKKVDPRRNCNNSAYDPVMRYFFAAKNGDLDHVKSYHAQGHDMKFLDYDNRTALHLAACEGRLNVVQYLVQECSLSVTVLDRWGRSPIDEARQNRHEVVLEYLFEVYASRYVGEAGEKKEDTAEKIQIAENNLSKEMDKSEESEDSSIAPSPKPLGQIAETPESDDVHSRDERPDLTEIRQAADLLIGPSVEQNPLAARK